MYPAIELFTALVFVACYLSFGISPSSLKWLLFSSILIVLIVTDFRERILPDVVNWFGVGMGIALAVRIPPVDGPAAVLIGRYLRGVVPPWGLGVLDAILGAALSGGLLWAAAILYRVIRGREGMGFGDVKMMFMVGTFLGVRGAFLTILLGTLLGTVIGVGVIAVLFVSGWKSAIALRASKMGLGKVATLRWTIASRYQLPLGTFLGVAAFMIIFLGPWSGSRWSVLPAF